MQNTIELISCLENSPRLKTAEGLRSTAQRDKQSIASVSQGMTDRYPTLRVRRRRISDRWRDRSNEERGDRDP